MSQLEIVVYPDAVLRQRAAEVLSFDAGVAQFVQNLTDTLYSTSGIGLSAPQVGDSRRILIMDLSSDQSACEVFINPVIENKAGMAFILESCLSLPGIRANIMRAPQVLVRAQDVNGEQFERELEGMHAVCLQHELDHLDGRLFIDHVSRLRALRFRKTLKALEQGAQYKQEKQAATVSACNPS